MHHLAFIVSESGSGGFLGCSNTGIILGDPVGGRFVVYRSQDRGQHWQREDNPGLAASPEREGVFAASNSSLFVGPGSELLFGTGGLDGPRVFRLSKGANWEAIKVPLTGGKESAGIFSVAFRDHTHGIAVAGDYRDATQAAGTAAWTSDGGATWQAASVMPSGYRSCVGWDRIIRAWITVGTDGSDLSLEWKRFDSGNWNALSLPWAVGSGGKIARLDTASPAIRNALRSSKRPQPK